MIPQLRSTALRVLLVWAPSTAVCLMAIGVLLGLPTGAASAQTDLRPSSGVFVTDEQIAEAFGSIRYDVSCPEMPEDADNTRAREVANGRGTRITLSRYSDRYRDDELLAWLLSQGRKEALRQCPYLRGDGIDMFDIGFGDPGSIDIYSEDGSGRLHLVHNPDLFMTGVAPRVTDVYGERLAAEDQQRRQREEAEEEAAEANRQAQIDAERRVQVAADVAVQREVASGRLETFWEFIKAAFALAVIAMLWANREALLRFWYELRPHPARQLVDAAIYNGEEIDGTLYAEIHRPEFGNAIENAVRSRQADDLTSRLRRHEAALRSEEATRIAEVRRKVEQENAFMRAHAELLKAGVDHEVAAARVDELRKATKGR